MHLNPKKFLHGLLYAAPVVLLTLAACGGGGGGGTTTAPVVAPSTAPTGVSTYSGCYAINLNWTAVTGATGYNVYGAASGVTPALLAATTTTSYTDAGLLVNTPRNYQVTATNSAGESPKSTLVFASTQPSCTHQGGSIQGTPLNLGNVVSTLAGSAGKLGLVNATGASAQFNKPAGITTDGTYLYVADAGNNAIRKIAISTGAVSTWPTVVTSFNGPLGITTDGTNLYVADTQHGTIKTISTSGAVSIISSGFNVPAAITYNGIDLYVADSGNKRIVRLSLSGAASSVFATLPSSPQGITYDGTNFYATSGNDIVQITPGGASFVIATTSSLNSLQGITTDGTNLYVSNSVDHTILKVATTKAVSLVAGTAGTPGSADGTGSAAQFRNPNGITTDGTNLYIGDTGNQTIRKIE